MTGAVPYPKINNSKNIMCGIVLGFFVPNVDDAPGFPDMPELRELMQTCWERTPELRISMRDCITAIDAIVSRP